MTRLRWGTVDARGEGWARGRRRAVAVWLAVAVAGTAFIGATSDAGDAAETPPSLELLEQQRRAELAAVDAAYGSALADLERVTKENEDRLGAALAADLVTIGATTSATASALDSNTQAAVADSDRWRLTAHADLDLAAPLEKAAIDRFFTDVLAQLGPEGGTPTTAALDAAKKSLEAKRAAELSPLSASQAAAEDALKAQVDQSLATLEAERRRLDAEYAATKAAIEVAYQAAKRAIADRVAATVAAIEADTTAIKARHAQELLTLDDIHNAQTAAAATASGAARSALADRQHREEDDLKDLHAGELGAQGAAKKQAEEDASTATANATKARDADLAAAKSAHDAAAASVDAERARARAGGDAAIHGLEDENEAAYAALKGTYDTAVAAVAKGHAAVRTAWAARIAQLDADTMRRHAAIDRRFDVERARLGRAREDRLHALERKLGDDRQGRQRRLDVDLDVERREHKARVATAQRDRDRQRRLTESAYFSLKIRAVAFLEHPGEFTSVGAAFDPATDPGSLWSVARRIGVDHLDADVTGAGVDVALIDTGVIDVPGLAEANIEIGPDFSFEDAVPELRTKDTNGHGTHLAGIINGRDAAWTAGDHARRPDRFLGIAPDARLISIKAGSADGSVDVSQIIAAINWVVANRNSDGRNIRVLNLAFGTDSVQDYRIDPLAAAVERAWHAGIVVVVAGGNDGWNAERLTNPAQDPYVIAVGASQAVNGRESVPATYSNGSASGRRVDLSAPGRSIVSLRNPGSYSDAANEAGRTGDRLVRGSGTSQAAAVTSGAVALLLSERPSLKPDQVKYLLTHEADRDNLTGDLSGGGYLRVDEAMRASAPYAPQTWDRATGSGSLDAARGSVRVAQDGVVLEGEFDIFGTDWSGSKWSQDGWSGSKWSGSKWSGSKWSGSKWSTDLWTGSKWSGSKWSTSLWTGSKWSGSKWSAEGWSGSKWSAGAWFGVGWDDGPSVDAVVGAEVVTPQAEALAAD